MDILILSDSHGHRDMIREAMSRVRPGAVLFAGDGLRDIASLELDRLCPVYAVRGNCDMAPPPVTCANASSAGDVGEESLFEIEGFRILLVHGHRYGVKSGYFPAALRAASLEADVLIFGHTHQPLELYLYPDDGGMGSELKLKKPLWIFNPGSVGDRTHTFGTMTIHRNQLMFGHGCI